MKDEKGFIHNSPLILHPFSILRFGRRIPLPPDVLNHPL
jgi:hypothetical protein